MFVTPLARLIEVSTDDAPLDGRPLLPLSQDSELSFEFVSPQIAVRLSPIDAFRQPISQLASCVCSVVDAHWIASESFHPFGKSPPPFSLLPSLHAHILSVHGISSHRKFPPPPLIFPADSSSCPDSLTALKDSLLGSPETNA